MRYNPKAKLDDDQVNFKRQRAGGKVYADRFSDLTKETKNRSELESKDIYRNAMKRRMQKRGDYYG